MPSRSAGMSCSTEQRVCPAPEGNRRPGAGRTMSASLSTMGIENPVHLLFIAIVALIVLGPKRLPGLARALGHGIREFREAIGQGESAAGPRAPPRAADPVEPVWPAQAVDPVEPVRSPDA